MKTITLEEFHTQAKAQGVPREHVAFKCVACQTVQSATDLIKAGAGKDLDEVQRFLGFSCVGRFTGANSPRKEPDGEPCNWTLGGLFQMHEVQVKFDNGDYRPCFELATPEEAQANALKNGLEVSV